MNQNWLRDRCCCFRCGDCYIHFTSFVSYKTFVLYKSQSYFFINFFPLTCNETIASILGYCSNSEVAER